MIKILPIGLLKNLFSYTFFNILNAVTPFILIPILTNSLTKEGYGLVAMFTIVVSFLIPITGFSVNGAITRQFYFLDESELKKYINNCIYILMASLIFLSFVLLLFSKYLYIVTKIPSGWLFKAMLIAGFTFTHNIFLVLLQVNNKPIWYGFFQIFNSILNLGLTIVFVKFYSQGWEGRLNAWLLASFLMFCFVLYKLYIQKMLFNKFNRDKVVHALKFGIPLIPHAIGGLFIALSDRLIITNILNVEATGIYTIAFQLASILGILMNSLNTAFVPWLFESLNANSEIQKRKIVTMTYVVFIGIIIAVLFGNYMIDLLFSCFIGDNFLESKKYILVLLSAFGFNGMYLMVTNYLFYIEKTILLAKSTFMIALLNLPLCYYLTLWYGLVGATYATAIAYFLLFVITWILSAKSYKMPWFNPYLFKSISND
jgi:O-antigen/teichoic acid export membrane protein